jgi:hypothetical protein
LFEGEIKECDMNPGLVYSFYNYMFILTSLKDAPQYGEGETNFRMIKNAYGVMPCRNQEPAAVLLVLQTQSLLQE